MVIQLKRVYLIDIIRYYSREILIIQSFEKVVIIFVSNSSGCQIPSASRQESASRRDGVSCSLHAISAIYVHDSPEQQYLGLTCPVFVKYSLIIN